MQDLREYWETYYSSKTSSGRAKLPSQFSVFVAGEIPEGVNTIVDVGCGDGRDSFFFLSSGYCVMGLDASASAVESCWAFLRTVARQHSVRAEFAQIVVDTESGSRLAALTAGSERVVVYARFFLHAISDREEQAFFAALDSIRHKIALVAVEFRTDRDAQRAKVTPDHYRRFIDPTDVVQRAADAGYEVKYSVQGFGMAKFRQDDAHVARLLFRPA